MGRMFNRMYLYLPCGFKNMGGGGVNKLTKSVEGQ